MKVIGYLKEKVNDLEARMIYYEEKLCEFDNDLNEVYNKEFFKVTQDV